MEALAAEKKEKSGDNIGKIAASAFGVTTNLLVFCFNYFTHFFPFLFAHSHTHTYCSLLKVVNITTKKKRCSNDVTDDRTEIRNQSTEK
jgi:hypothetical protein